MLHIFKWKQNYMLIQIISDTVDLFDKEKLDGLN